jgi:hypothetical protein
MDSQFILCCCVCGQKEKEGRVELSTHLGEDGKIRPYCCLHLQPFECPMLAAEMSKTAKKLVVEHWSAGVERGDGLWERDVVFRPKEVGQRRGKEVNLDQLTPWEGCATCLETSNTHRHLMEIHRPCISCPPSIAHSISEMRRMRSAGLAACCIHGITSPVNGLTPCEGLPSWAKTDISILPNSVFPLLRPNVLPCTQLLCCCAHSFGAGNNGSF